MVPQDAVSPLAAILPIIGALLFTLGLGELLLGGRGKATLSPVHAGSAPSPPERPAPFTIDGGGAAHSKSGAAVLLAPDAGTGAADSPGEGAAFPPPSLTPAPSYAAIVLTRSGRWGSYWQESARCGHAHPNIWAAWDCACLPPADGLPDEYLLAVGPAE